MQVSFQDQLQVVSHKLSREFRLREWGITLRALIVVLGVHLACLTGAGLALGAYPLIAWPYFVLTGLLFLYLLFPLAALGRYRRFRRNPTDLAEELDAKNPNAQDIFRITLSLPRHPPEMQKNIATYYAKFTTHLHNSDFTIPRAGTLMASTLLLVYLLVGALQVDSGGYFKKTLLPFLAVGDIPRLDLSLSTQSEKVGKGDTVIFVGEVSGRYPGQPLYFHVIRSEGESRYPARVQENQTLFDYVANESFAIFLSGTGGRSQLLEIEVLEKPRLSGLQAVVTPPAYTGLPPDTLTSGRTNFTIYPGSRVRWDLQSQRPLQQFAWVEQEDSGRAQSILQSKDEKRQHFSLEKTFSGIEGKPEVGIRLPYRYAFALKDDFGIRSQPEHFFEITPKVDERPRIEIIEPDNQYKLSHNEKLKFSLMVDDDFGIRSLNLNYHVTSDGFSKDSGQIDVTRWTKDRSGNFIQSEWDLNPFNLRPDNQVEVFFKVCDNDLVSGPKCTRSDTRTLVFPSMREILQEVASHESEAESSLKSAMERQKKISQKLKRLQEGGEEHSQRVPLFEARNILITDPKKLVKQAESLIKENKAFRELEAHKSRAGKTDSGLDKIKKAAEVLKRSIPDNDVINHSNEKKLASLEKLTTAHEKMQKAMENRKADQSSQAPDKSPREKSRIEGMERQLEKNLESQQSLKEFLQAEKAGEERKAQLQKELLAEQEQTAEDIKQSIDDIQSLLEKSAQEQIFSEDLLQKMEEIQELLKETLSDSLMEMMRKKMEGESVKAEDLKNSLENLLNQKDSFEQNVDRALNQLKKLKAYMQIEAWKKDLEFNARSQQETASKIQGNSGLSREEKQDLVRNQERINQSMQSIMQEMSQSAELRKAGKPELSQKKRDGLSQDLNSLNQTMKKLNSENQKSTGESAGKAGDKMQSMANALGEMMAGMNNGGPSLNPYEIQVLIYESLQLASLQSIIPGNSNLRKRKGWESDPGILYSSALGAARWLYQNLQKLSAEYALISPYLLTQARLLVSHLESLTTEQRPTDRESALANNQNVTRELLKLFHFLKNMPQGSGQGSGGEGQEGSDQPGNQSGSSPGKEGLSQSLQGISGKQLALNQSTHQLLQSMLQSRSQGRQPGGSRVNKKENGVTGSGGSTPHSLANDQGRLSEQLEELAESSGNEGGAASKIRKLAEEARTLEGFMRKGKVTPDLLENQEKFKSRLLDASRALEERGFSQQREGKFSEKSYLPEGVNSELDKTLWLKYLEKEQKKLKNLALTPLEKQRISKFYESLITRSGYNFMLNTQTHLVRNI